MKEYNELLDGLFTEWEAVSIANGDGKISRMA